MDKFEKFTQKHVGKMAFFGTIPSVLVLFSWLISSVLPRFATSTFRIIDVNFTALTIHYYIDSAGVDFYGGIFVASIVFFCCLGVLFLLVIVKTSPCSLWRNFAVDGLFVIFIFFLLCCCFSFSLHKSATKMSFEFKKSIMLLQASSRSDYVFLMQKKFISASCYRELADVQQQVHNLCHDVAESNSESEGYR